MHNGFFPRDPKFWLYHSLGALGVASVDLITSFLAPHLMPFKLWAGLVLWPIFFTASTLTFRWLYNRYPVFQDGVGKLIPFVIIYATGAAVISATGIVAILMPFFWSLFVSREHMPEGINWIGVAAPLMLTVSLSGQLFITVWAFIYVFVRERRRATNSELHNLRLQNTLKEAQLTSLSSQLNPHFLFNSLNNIRFVMHENPQRADRMITALSEILRYSLTSSVREEVELAEELNICNRFIDIVKLQYEERLVYVADVPHSCMRFRIPPMSLQLLVENAVKHGIEHMRTGGIITVKVAEKQSGYSVTVTNSIPEFSAGIVSTTGTGLTNIRHRLHLLYGEQGHLHTNQIAHAFTAQLYLPKEHS